MWFKRQSSERVAAPVAVASAQTSLTFHELIAVQTRLLRGPLAPGERFPSGMRPGRRRAQGVDLDSIGPYVPGDDVRWMDWRATARTGRAQMKRFIAESHRARMLVIDMAAHMFFATRKQPMAKTAALIAARFAWEALSLHEPVGLIVAPIPETIRVRRGKNHILRILGHLEACYLRLEKEKSGDYESPITSEQALAQAMEVASGSLRRGDELCVISDFGHTEGVLDQTAARLSEIRKLYAVLIEDAVFSQPVPVGRYPVQTIDNTAKQMISVATKDSVEQARIADEMRKTLRLRLLRSGWQAMSTVSTDVLRPEFEL